MSPERLWIPRLALSRLQIRIFPSSALSRITAPYSGLFHTFSKRYGVQCAMSAANCACLACSHFSVQSFCSNSLYIIFCVSLVLYSLRIFNYLHFRSAQNIERSACRTARYFAIAVDHTPPSCRILWSHFCAIKTSQILSIAVCKNRHMPSWHSWHSN